MTPEEKAKELVSKMDVIHYMKLGGKNSNSKGVPLSMHDDQIKQCALIAVDEIIKSHYKVLGGVNQSIFNYWENVKHEIELL